MQFQLPTDITSTSTVSEIILHKLCAHQISFLAHPSRSADRVLRRCMDIMTIGHDQPTHLLRSEKEGLWWQVSSNAILVQPKTTNDTARWHQWTIHLFLPEQLNPLYMFSLPHTGEDERHSEYKMRCEKLEEAYRLILEAALKIENRKTLS